jgi:hypothetical protein
VYCEAKGFEGRYKIEKDVQISSAELKTIEIATNFIFQQDEQRAVILNDSRTACQILMKAMEGDRYNKIAMRILKGIQNTQKQITIKWIPARNGTPINHYLQLKEHWQMQWEAWNNWYVLKAVEKGLFRTGTVVQKHKTIKCRHTHGKQNTHNAHIHTNLGGKNGGSNRGGL